MSPTPLPPDSTNRQPRVAVIGGGISGLAAAFRISELLPHAQLALFEASNRLGGVLDTIYHDGFLIERSADNFLARPAQAVDLCRRLGLESELVTTDESRRRAFVVRDGKLTAIPDGFYLMSPRKLWPVITSPMLSVAGKLRLLAEPFIPRGPAASRKRNATQSTTMLEHDESVAAFVRRRFGRETFERIVQPLVAGIYTADSERLSMAGTMPQFLEYERTYRSLLFATLRRRLATSPNEAASGARYGLFLAPKGGLQTLVTALANRLPPNSVQLNSKVTQIQFHENTWTIDCTPSSPFHAPHSPFDLIILATPAYAAASLLKSLDAPLSTELAAIEYSSCAVVSLGFHRSQIAHPLDGFGFVVPAVEHRRIIAASFASLKYPGRAPADNVLIRVFIGGATQAELLDRTDDELLSIAVEELSQLLDVHGNPIVTDVTRWPRSMPQYHVGHLARIARIEQSVAKYPTLALAGNAYHGVGIPQCIASGLAAAERIAAACAVKS